LHLERDILVPNLAFTFNVLYHYLKYNVIVIPWVGNSIRLVTHHEVGLYKSNPVYP
jgi:hypothetical protein